MANFFDALVGAMPITSFKPGISRSTKTASMPARRHSTSQAMSSLSLPASSDWGTASAGPSEVSRRRPEALAMTADFVSGHFDLSIQTRPPRMGKETALDEPTNAGVRRSRGFHGDALLSATNSAKRLAMKAGASVLR